MFTVGPIEPSGIENKENSHFQYTENKGIFYGQEITFLSEQDEADFKLFASNNQCRSKLDFELIPTGSDEVNLTLKDIDIQCDLD